MQVGFDVIGDIHGHAQRLEALLAAMDYRQRNGVWRHPERRALFVGDFVDRGPENVRACRIAMAMTQAGSALAVMGNHDFNAVCLATPDPAAFGSFLRPHTEKNLHQSSETRAEMERSPCEAAAVLAWLRRLPLWIEREDARVAHACWSTKAIAALAPFVDAEGALTEEGLVRAARKGDPMQQAREVLLNGPEADLPAGVSYLDADGHLRRSARLAWWKPMDGAVTWRDAVHADDQVLAQLPHAPVPGGLSSLFDPFNASRVATCPIFFGHYWMSHPLTLQGPGLACVDASVAKDGKLAAYRYSGEPELSADRFVYA
ncbi:MAG: metallophosphoesterase [Hyphomicrobiales bacterium]